MATLGWLLLLLLWLAGVLMWQRLIGKPRVVAHPASCQVQTSARQAALERTNGALQECAQVLPGPACGAQVVGVQCLHRTLQLPRPPPPTSQPHGCSTHLDIHHQAPTCAQVQSSKA
jgi:hypothetical protein